MQLPHDFFSHQSIQWLGKVFPEIMRLIVLFRVTWYFAKNYFMIDRQEMQRTTTYADTHAALLAKLEAAKIFKTTKDK